MSHSTTIFKASNVYIALWLVYNLQGVLYESGGIISASILGILLFWSIFHFFKVNKLHSKPCYIKGLNTLLILLSIYGYILILSGKNLYITEEAITRVRNIDYLKGIYSSLLPIYSFYFFTHKGQITEYSLKRWVILFFVVVTAQYFRLQRENLARLIITGSSHEETTNNAGYIFLSLIPTLTVFYNKKQFQFIGLGICMLFMLLAMKRGALIIGLVSSLFFIHQEFKVASRKTKFRYFLAIITLGVLGYIAVEHMLNTSDYFNSRLQATIDGDDSNRSIMYGRLWKAFSQDTSLFQFLMGRGAWGTLTVNTNFAHNDWLEILTNQGVIGIIVYIYYWICFYKTINSKDISNNSRICLSIIFIICSLKTLFSMSYSSIEIYLSCMLGVCLSGGFSDKMALISNDYK